MSAQTIYRVTYAPKARVWVLKRDGGTTVHSYPTRDNAMVEGQRAARNDKPSQLVVHRKDGEAELEWSYGEASYVLRTTPPAGVALASLVNS